MESVSAQTSASTAPSRPRPKRAQAVLEVTGRTRISPRLLRITLGGADFSLLHRNEHADAYVKLLLADPASGLEPPYDLDAIREETPELLPSRRTYTVRRWHDGDSALDIDVVLHGDGAGVAARWADAALPGDRIAVSGAGGGYTPDADAGQHLLIGDHATVPAIASALESMEDTARGTVLIHLDHEEERLTLDHPAGVDVRWVIGERQQLLEEVAALDLSEPERFQVFCHAERELTKQLRRVLIKEAGVPRPQVSVSAYWAQGRIEDQFQAEKREPIGRIDD